MKKAVLLLFLVTAFNFAQNTTKEELLKTIAQETCDCMATKELTDANLELNLGVCMLQSVETHQSEFDALYGEDALLNEETMYNFGKSIGMKMAGVCPQIFMDHLDNLTETEDQDEDFSFIGKVTKIETEPFYCVYVKERSGAEMKFIVLEYFDSADLLLDKKVKTQDQIQVNYYQSELFDVKTKEFTYFNILTNIAKE